MLQISPVKSEIYSAFQLLIKPRNMNLIISDYGKISKLLCNQRDPPAYEGPPCSWDVISGTSLQDRPSLYSRDQFSNISPFGQQLIFTQDSRPLTVPHARNWTRMFRSVTSNYNICTQDFTLEWHRQRPTQALTGVSKGERKCLRCGPQVTMPEWH